MQSGQTDNLSHCKQVMEVAVALRTGLYTRAQVLQLLRAPLTCGPVDLSLLSQPTNAQPLASVGVTDSGELLDRQ